MQHEITQDAPLLNRQGDIREPGWSRRMLLHYARADIRAGALRIKEWDYYIVHDGRFGVALTVADNGYMGLLSASVLDFSRPWEHTASAMTAFPMGGYRMPATSAEGNAQAQTKQVRLCFEKDGGQRRLHCEYKNFLGGETLTAELTLEEPDGESIVIATPFLKPRHFYYNQKINCMPASGNVRLGELTFSFAPETAFATLDWGRGVWTYDNTWYWGNANGVVNGEPLGFNIGYGFGDTRAASENAIFYGHTLHKLEEVAFHIPADFLKPWTFSSSDGRFEMDFVPVLDRAAHMNVLVLESDQHQVFGRFTGRAVLDDGTALEIKNLMGFAEKVRNRY